jgi:NodT family efflux transporter outer membrane factor (OMF) lipoprotein
MHAHCIRLPLLVLLLAVGCKVAEPPASEEVRRDALPMVDSTATWRSVADTARVLDNWLATFQDEQLNALVAEALAHSPDLATMGLRVEQAGKQVELARAAMRPAVGLLGIGGLNLGGGDISSPLQGASLSVSWEPDLWGRLRHGRNAAMETYASAQADLEFARQSLAAMVARSWFTAVEARSQQRIADGMRAYADTLVQLADQRVRTGAGSELEVAQLRVSSSTYRDAERQLELSSLQALRAVELLVGRYPAGELAIRAELPAFPGPVPAGMPLDMLERRPDLIAAERRVAAAFHRVGEAKAARLPRLVLSANGSVINSDVLELAPDFENPSLGAGGKLIVPIYQGGALNTQVEIRTLQQKEAMSAYAQVALKAFGDVEQALAAAPVLEERTAILRNGITDQTRAADLAGTQERIGRGDHRGVMQQQLALASMRSKLVSLQSLQLSRRVDLHLALGGGFRSADTDTNP